MKFKLILFPIMVIVLILAVMSVTFAWFFDNEVVTVNPILIEAENIARIELATEDKFMFNYSVPYMGQDGATDTITDKAGNNLNEAYFAVFKNIPIKAVGDWVSTERQVHVIFELCDAYMYNAFSYNENGDLLTGPNAPTLQDNYENFIRATTEKKAAKYIITNSDLLNHFAVYVYMQRNPSDVPIAKHPTALPGTTEYNVDWDLQLSDEEDESSAPLLLFTNDYGKEVDNFNMISTDVCNITVKIRFYGGDKTDVGGNKIKFRFHNDENIGSGFYFALKLTPTIKYN